MIAADLGRLLLLAAIPLAAVLGWLTIELLCIVAALVSILTVFFELSYLAFVPVLVSREHIVEANSKLEMALKLGQLEKDRDREKTLAQQSELGRQRSELLAQE